MILSKYSDDLILVQQFCKSRSISEGLHFSIIASDGFKYEAKPSTQVKPDDVLIEMYNDGMQVWKCEEDIKFENIKSKELKFPFYSYTHTCFGFKIERNWNGYSEKVYFVFGKSAQREKISQAIARYFNDFGL